jgi:hypothetical protein
MGSVNSVSETRSPILYSAGYSIGWNVRVTAVVA